MRACSASSLVLVCVLNVESIIVSHHVAYVVGEKHAPCQAHSLQYTVLVTAVRAHIASLLGPRPLGTIDIGNLDLDFVLNNAELRAAAALDSLPQPSRWQSRTPSHRSLIPRPVWDPQQCGVFPFRIFKDPHVRGRGAPEAPEGASAVRTATLDLLTLASS